MTRGSVKIRQKKHMKSNLTERKHWDKIWFQSVSKNTDKIIHTQSLFSTYSNYLFWDVLLGRYISTQKEKRVLEIGSAPGHFLVFLNKRFNMIPYGIEYSQSGIEKNREIFM
jgi:tRNA1(Val) A37 N6-methylase TrmN6